MNHRPVYGIGKQSIQEALRTLAQTQPGSGDPNDQQSNEKQTLTREELLDILQFEGERLTQQEIKGNPATGAKC